MTEHEAMEERREPEKIPEPEPQDSERRDREDYGEPREIAILNFA